MSQDFPPSFFARLDESDDAAFYAAPRFVVHIDDATIAELLAKAERDCFIGASLTVTPAHTWRVA